MAIRLIKKKREPATRIDQVNGLLDISHRILFRDLWVDRHDKALIKITHDPIHLKRDASRRIETHPIEQVQDDVGALVLYGETQITDYAPAGKGEHLLEKPLVPTQAETTLPEMKRTISSIDQPDHQSDRQ